MKSSPQEPKYSYQGLFFLMILSLLTNAFFHGLVFFHYLANVIFTLVLLAMVYAFSKNKKHFIIISGLALLTIATTWHHINARNTLSQLMDQGLNIIFFGYLIILIGRTLFKTEKVTGDIIFGTLCLYLMLAFFWGFSFIVLDILNPNSFDLGGHPHNPTTYLYYSFITLSTLGYGDIVPLTPQAQTLAAFETVMGQFFIAVVVARYVGILVAQRLGKPDGS